MNHPSSHPATAPRRPSAVREAAVIVFAGILLALTANAVSPRGIPLVGDFSRGASQANRSEEEIAALAGEVSADEVAAAIAAADSLGVLVLDARAPEDYATGHIPGALNLSTDAFDTAYPALADTLGGASRLIVYCDGGDCELSHDLAMLLKERGHKAIQLFPAGIAGWIEAGKEVREGSEP